MSLKHIYDVPNKNNTDNNKILCDNCNHTLSSHSLCYVCSSKCSTYCITCGCENYEEEKYDVNSKENENDDEFSDAETEEMREMKEMTENPNKNKKSNSVAEKNESTRRPKGVIIACHGGGYIGLTAKVGDLQYVLLSRLTGMIVVSVEYRKPPRYPLPACVEDVIKVYKYYYEQYDKDSSKIVFTGGSAGGGLILLALQRIRDNIDGYNLPMPACAIPISPFSDITCHSKSYFFNRENDAMIPYDVFGNLSKQSPGNLIVNNWDNEKPNLFYLNNKSRLQRRHIRNIKKHKYLIEDEQKYKNHPWYRFIKHLYDKHFVESGNNDSKNEIVSKYKRLDHPMFSAVFGEFHSLCPLYFIVGETEILLHDTLKCVQKCRKAKVDVEVEIHPYCPHVYPCLSNFPEAIESNARIASFIAKHVK